MRHLKPAIIGKTMYIYKLIINYNDRIIYYDIIIDKWFTFFLEN